MPTPLFADAKTRRRAAIKSLREFMGNHGIKKLTKVRRRTWGNRMIGLQHQLICVTLDRDPMRLQSQEFGISWIDPTAFEVDQQRKAVN